MDTTIVNVPSNGATSPAVPVLSPTRSDAIAAFSEAKHSGFEAERVRLLDVATAREEGAKLGRRLARKDFLRDVERYEASRSGR